MIYVLIILVLLLIMVAAHQPTRYRARRVADEVVGVCAVALERSSQKQTRKDKVLELLGKNGELSNEELRSALGVSARSVVNYMDELEAEDKIEQVGDTGRSVRYRLKPKHASRCACLAEDATSNQN
jgi:predicted HTH transcriptional regulator